MATVERHSSNDSGFREWRATRPFWGGLLLIVASLIIAWVPIQFAFELMLIGGAFTVIGLVFALLVFLSGVAALLKPNLATLAGIAGIGFSILSLVGALGGLLIGALLGLAGGSLCIAWEAPGAAERREETDTPRASTVTDADFEWQEDPAASRAGGVATGRSWDDSETEEAEGTPESGYEPATFQTDTDAADESSPDFEWQDDPGASTAGGAEAGRSWDDSEADEGTEPSTTGEPDATDSSAEPEPFEMDDTAEEDPTFSWQEDPYAEEENDEN